MKKTIKITLFFASITVIGGTLFLAFNPSARDVTEHISEAIDLTVNNEATSVEVEDIRYNKIKTNLANEFKCNSLLAEFELPKEWQQEKEQAIKNYILDLAASNVSSSIINEILLNTNIGLMQGRHYLKNSNRTNLGSLLPESSKPLLSSGSLLQLQALITKQDIQGIVSAYKNKQWDGNKWIYYNFRSYPPIGLVIKLMKEKQSDITDSELNFAIEDLLQADTPVNFQDLVIATEVGLPVELLALLVNNFGDDLNQAFLHQDNWYSLVSFAQILGQFPLSDYWLSLQVKANPFSSHSDKSNIYFSLEDTVIINGKLRELYDIVLDNSHQLGLKLTKQLTCNNLLAQRLIAQLYEHNKISYRHVKNTLEKTGMPKYLPSAEEVKANIITLQNQLLTRQEILFNLGKNKDQAGKFSVNKYLIDQSLLEIKQREAANPRRKSPLSLEQQDSFKKLIKEGNWQNALNLAEEQDNTEFDSQQELNEAFGYSLMLGADIKVLLDLLDRGSKPNINLMSSIINRGNMTLIESLLQHGFNFNHVSQLGKGAITYAIEYKQPQLLAYFISKGYSVKPSTYGSDPLDYALQQLKTTPYNFTYINMLIAAGAPIEISHKEEVQSFILFKSDLYNMLTNKHPQLIM